jgi:Raf kinase inhibitor-like YbhB/YbcL family protein
MWTRRRFAATVGAAATAAIAGCGAGEGNGTGALTHRNGTGTVGSDGGGATATTTAGSTLTLAPVGFRDGGSVPEEFTCDGRGISPAFEFSDVPPETETLALVVLDPDATGGTFVHWLLWNVPGDRRRLPTDIPRNAELDSLGGARQGRNGAGEVGYVGPCPPTGDDPHRYRFTLYAVDRTLDAEPGAGRGRLDAALSETVLGTSTVAARYSRG